MAHSPRTRKLLKQDTFLNSYAVCLCLSCLSMYIYSYIYLICTHVHTPHEFSRPKHPDKGFFKLGHKIHPPQNLDYTNDSNPSVSSPVLLLGLHQIPEFFVRKRWWLDRWKNVRPSLRKKKFNPKMIGTYFISTPISKSLQIDRSFFFQLPPIETITSQAINLTPSTVWCRAAYFATLRGWPSWSLRLGHGCLAVFEKKTVMSG